MISLFSLILTIFLALYGFSLIICHWFLFNNVFYIVSLFLGLGIFILSIFLVIFCRILFFPLSTLRRLKRQFHSLKRKFTRRKFRKVNYPKITYIKKINVDGFIDRNEGQEECETLENKTSLFDNLKLGLECHEFTQSDNYSCIIEENKDEIINNEINQQEDLNYADPSVSVLAHLNSFISSNTNKSDEVIGSKPYFKNYYHVNSHRFGNKSKNLEIDEYQHGFLKEFTNIRSGSNFSELLSKNNPSKLSSIRSKAIHMYDRYFLRGLSAFFSKDFVQVSLFLINVLWALLWIVDTTFLTRDSYKEPWKIKKGVNTLLLFEEAFLWIADISLLYKILIEISHLSRGINRIITLKYLITSTTFVPLFEVLTTSTLLLATKYYIGSGTTTTLFMMGFLRYFRLLNPMSILNIVFSSESEVMKICMLIIWTIICVVLGFSGAMMIIESPHPKFTTLFDFFYFTIITISTVGYGDYTPAHFVSRLICIVLIIFTIIYIPNQISKLVQLAQTPPETIGLCNIGVYDERVFEKEHIHTTLILIIGSPSIKHLSYLLLELNQLNSNIDYIKQFNGTSGNIIRYQPIVMLLTTDDPREYSVLVKNSQRALSTELFVKKLKNFETLKEDIENIKGFIHAIYFWSDAINARIVSQNSNFENEENREFDTAYKTEERLEKEDKLSKVVTKDQFFDLERNTMMNWYAVRKFLSLKEDEYFYKKKETESIFISEKSLFRRYDIRNPENLVFDETMNYSINSVVVFNGENSDFKLDNAIRDDHFYDLYGIQDINTARRSVLTNSLILQAPKNPDEINSYLFYLSKVSGTNHYNEMRQINNVIKKRLNFDYNQHSREKHNLEHLQENQDSFNHSDTQNKLKNSYKPVYVAEIRSRLLAKTALCPGFSTLLTNLFNTIKIENDDMGESLYCSMKNILNEYGDNQFYYKNEYITADNLLVTDKETIQFEMSNEQVTKTKTEFDFSELERGNMNIMTTMDENKFNGSIDIISKAGLLTRDYIRGTHCELLEIPLPNYLMNMQFLQIVSYLFDNYSMICIGISVNVSEKSNIGENNDCNSTNNSSSDLESSYFENEELDDECENSDLYSFVIASEEEDNHEEIELKQILKDKNKSNDLDESNNLNNKVSIISNNSIDVVNDSEKSGLKKLKLLPNMLKIKKLNNRLDKSDFEPEKNKTNKTDSLGLNRRRRILNPIDFVTGKKWKYGDLVIEKNTEINLMIISNSRKKIFSFIHEKGNLENKLESYRDTVNLRTKQTLNYIRLCLQGKTQLIKNKLIIPSWRVDSPLTPRIRKSSVLNSKIEQIRGLPPSPIHRDMKYSKISKIERLEMLCPSKIEGYIHGTTFVLLVCEWPECLEEFLNGIVLNRSIPVGWDSSRYNHRFFKASVPVSSQSLILSTIIVFLSDFNNDKYFQKAIVPPGCTGVYIKGNSSNDEDLIRSGLFYAHSIVVCSSNSKRGDANVVTTCWRIHSLINMKIQAEVVLLKNKGIKYNNKSKLTSDLQRKDNSAKNGSQIKNKNFRLFDAKWNMWQWKITANLAQLTKKWLFEGGHLPPCFFPAIIADIRFEESLPLLDNTSWISSAEWDFSTCPTVISGRVLTTDMIIPIVYRSVRINPLLATSDSMKPLLGYNEKYNFFNSPVTFDDQVKQNNYSNTEFQKFLTTIRSFSPESDVLPEYTEWGALELISIPEQFYGSSFSTLFKEMLRISGIIIVGLVHNVGNNHEIPSTSLQNSNFSDDNRLRYKNNYRTNSDIKNHFNMIAPKFSLNNRVLLLSPHSKYIISRLDLIYVITPITKIY